MRIIFMGSPQFAVPSLEVLHASHHQIIAVVTQPDRRSGRKLLLNPPPVKLTAHQLSIPVFQPASTRTPEFVAEMASIRPDALVVVAYGEILRANLLHLAPRGAINLHASLLPKYRGAAPVAWSILRGETVTGATTILINETMDAGPILLQESCPILQTDTAESLTKKLALLGAPLLKQSLDLVEQNQITPQPQDSSLASFAPRLKKEDGLVDWNRTATWISRQIRAFNPWPGTYSHFQGLLIKFWRANEVPERTSESPGTIFRSLKQTFWIACGEESVLEVLELQPQDRPRLAAAEFIHGYRIRIGSRFS